MNNMNQRKIIYTEYGIIKKKIRKMKINKIIN